MASDPFLTGGQPTTLVGALTAGLTIAGIFIRTLWGKVAERDKRIEELQDARVADQKEHTEQLLGVTEAMHQAVKPMEAAITALKEQKKRTND